MAIRIYLMPITGAGTRSDPRRPKYWNTDLSGINWTMMDYGIEPCCLVAANVTPTQHATLAAEADVVSPPADLTSTLDSTLTTVQNALESFNIPAGWVTSGMSFKTVVKVVAKIFMFCQRLNFYSPNRVFIGGITLDSTFGSLSAAMRTAMQNAATSLGLNTSGVTLSTTIRQAYKLLADEFPNVDLPVGGVTL